MEAPTKKEILKAVFIVLLLLNVGIFYFLLRSPSFIRLAIWNIKESGRESSFDWKPDNAPEYFHFEKNNKNLDIFRKDIMLLLENNKESEFAKVIAIAGYVNSLATKPCMKNGLFVWSSPEHMYMQIKQCNKNGAHCFHYGIVFSTFLSSRGIKSRLWALEGPDGPGKISHTVAEYYSVDYNKWILIDPTQGIYFMLNGRPLSVLELRQYLLYDKQVNISIKPIGNNIIDNSGSFLLNYSNFMYSVFLRSANDFTTKYDDRLRYGFFYKFSDYFDNCQSEVARGLNYLLGRKDYLIHYTDKFSRSLKNKIIIAKSLLYFFILSIIYTWVYFLKALVYGVRNLKYTIALPNTYRR